MVRFARGRGGVLAVQGERDVPLSPATSGEPQRRHRRDGEDSQRPRGARALCDTHQRPQDGWGAGTEEEPATQGDAEEVGDRLEGFRGLPMGLKLICLQGGGVRSSSSQ